MDLNIYFNNMGEFAQNIAKRFVFQKNQGVQRDLKKSSLRPFTPPSPPSSCSSSLSLFPCPLYQSFLSLSTR